MLEAFFENRAFGDVTALEITFVSFQLNVNLKLSIHLSRNRVPDLTVDFRNCSFVKYQVTCREIIDAI